MLTLYRGDPKTDGVVIGWFGDYAEAQCAIHEDARNHEEGTNYYLIKEEDDENAKRG